MEGLRNEGGIQLAQQSEINLAKRKRKQETHGKTQHDAGHAQPEMPRQRQQQRDTEHHQREHHAAGCSNGGGRRLHFGCQGTQIVKHQRGTDKEHGGTGDCWCKNKVQFVDIGGERQHKQGCYRDTAEDHREFVSVDHRFRQAEEGKQDRPDKGEAGTLHRQQS